jgi:hypothetical protein
LRYWGEVELALEEARKLATTAGARPQLFQATWGLYLTVHKHRNLFAHAPERLHDEITADYKNGPSPILMAPIRL